MSKKTCLDEEKYSVADKTPANHGPILNNVVSNERESLPVSEWGPTKADLKTEISAFGAHVTGDGAIHLGKVVSTVAGPGEVLTVTMVPVKVSHFKK